jgi:hypothetical protein
MDIERDSSLIDLLEEYIEVCGWEYARVASQVINFKRVGLWSEYSFYVTEQSNGTILLASGFELKLSKKKFKKAKKRVLKLINLFHSDVPLGTFSLDKNVESDDSFIAWAYRFYKSEVDEPDTEVVELVLQEALEELDEMYPSFQRVVLPGVTVQQAYDSAIPEVYGRA